MSQVIKTFLGVFLILFMTSAALGILSAYLGVMGAQDLQAQMVDEIENSNFASGVAQECFARAEEAGCELAVTYYYDGGGTTRCVRASQLPSNTGSVTMARVELTFPLEMKIFGFRKEHTFRGYAK
ncbi:MAG: hypothetical protein NC355_05960 [Blautia sp.]|nr:hypothetical protein [Blautia sp.]